MLRSRLHFFFYILFFIILITGIVYGIYFSFFKPGSTAIKTKATSSGVNLVIVPGTVSAPTGTDFTMTITMNTNSKRVSAAELHLTYDQTKLQGKSITAGTFLPVVLTQGSIGTGAASIILGSQPTSPATGSGIIATLSFTSLTSLTSQIGFSTDTKVTVVGETTNMVGDILGADINPSSTPSPTLTPTPTPTPAPSATPIVTSTPTPTSSPTPTPIQTLQVPNTPTPVAQSTPAGRRVAQTLVITNPSPTLRPTVTKPSPSPSPTILLTNPPIFPTSITTPTVNPTQPPVAKPTPVPKKPITGISFIDNILHFFGL